jgi:hypothetical protein
MRVIQSVAWTAAVAFLVCSSVDARQEPPMAKPGPEHQLFKMDEGVWDATVEITQGPGVGPMTWKGAETNTVGCGGLCLISDFTADMSAGMTFKGHGLLTWDPARKKYIGSWVDSMSGGLMMTEAVWDPTARKFEATMEGPDASGNVVKSRSVSEYKGDMRMMTAYAPGPDGKEMQVLRISYTRRK